MKSKTDIKEQLSSLRETIIDLLKYGPKRVVLALLELCRILTFGVVLYAIFTIILILSLFTQSVSNRSRGLCIQEMELVESNADSAVPLSDNEIDDSDDMDEKLLSLIKAKKNDILLFLKKERNR